MSSAKVYVQSRAKEPVDTTNMVIKINETGADAWSDFGQNMKESPLFISGNPERKWKIEVSMGERDREKLEDLLILIQYNITS